MDTVDECPDPDLDLRPDRFLPGMEGFDGQPGKQPEDGVTFRFNFPSFFWYNLSKFQPAKAEW